MTGSLGETQNSRSSTADIAGATGGIPQQQQGKDGVGSVTQPPSEQVVENQSGSGGQELNGADVEMDLLESAETEGFRSQWTSIQVGFVDEPQRAVESADALVADVMKRLAEKFAQERSRLESQWSRGDEVSTEELRLALQRYRSFFNRLLTT